MAPGLDCNALYRSYLRQVHRLPHEYLRVFFRLKGSDDIRALVATKKLSVWKSKHARFAKEVKRLTAANGGDKMAYAHILDLATGRKGKLKRELLEPVIHDPLSPLPERIISSVESSRPPVITPEFKALLLSDHGRPRGAINAKWIAAPQALPPRADPASEEARLVGPFSKRREVNIRWRFFTQEVRSIAPPLQVGSRQPDHGGEVAPAVGTSSVHIRSAGLRDLGMQGSGLFEDLVDIADPVLQRERLTRRQRKALQQDAVEPGPRYEVPRFIRRSYQGLLGRLPMLTYTENPKDPPKGRFDVAVHPHANVPGERHQLGRTRMVSEADMAWIRLSPEAGNSKRHPQSADHVPRETRRGEQVTASSPHSATERPHRPREGLSTAKQPSS